MLAVMDDTGGTACLGRAGVDWVRDYHSANRICALQLIAIDEFLGKSAAQGNDADGRAEVPAEDGMEEA